MTGRTLIFCKPYQVLSCFTDPTGRPTVGDYVDVPAVYAAGRLDYDSEGRNRQVRHMTAAVAHPTLRLVRLAVGPLTLGSLLPGQWRDLTAAELKTLWHSLS